MSDEGITSRPADPDWKGGRLTRDERIAPQPSAVSPAGDDDDWFVLSEGTEFGPFTTDELRVNLAAGTVRSEDQVRRGKGSWAPAKDFHRLATPPRGHTGTMPDSLIDRQPAKAGIGGWLIFPAIGLVLGGIAMAWAICQDFILIDSSRAASPGVHNALIAEIVLNCGMLLFQGYVAFAFFSRRRTVPALMIALILAHLLARIIDSAIVSLEVGPSPGVVFSAVRPLMAAAIWVPYFLLSRRVQATFVN